MLEDFFLLVAEAEPPELEITREDYEIWLEDIELDVSIELERGSLSMTEAEFRWVVLDALQRHIKEAADCDDELEEYVESYNLISALSENGFCPAFEDTISVACRDVIRKWEASPLKEVE